MASKPVCHTIFDLALALCNLGESDDVPQTRSNPSRVYDILVLQFARPRGSVDPQNTLN